MNKTNNERLKQAVQGLNMSQAEACRRIAAKIKRKPAGVQGWLRYPHNKGYRRLEDAMMRVALEAVQAIRREGKQKKT